MSTAGLVVYYKPLIRIHRLVIAADCTEYVLIVLFVLKNDNNYTFCPTKNGLKNSTYTRVYMVYIIASIRLTDMSMRKHTLM